MCACATYILEAFEPKKAESGAARVLHEEYRGAPRAGHYLVQGTTSCRALLRVRYGGVGATVEEGLDAPERGCIAFHA